MMSTTGRSPVIAAPTPIPVNPASEIGVSSTRSRPNSSTNPDKTLNGVPASATSSPRMHTRESRRISSANASRMASPKLSSRTFVSVSSIDVLIGFILMGERRRQRRFDCRVHLGFKLRANAIELSAVGKVLFDEPIGQDIDRIALGHPALLLLLGPVIITADVADMMTA